MTCSTAGTIINVLEIASGQSSEMEEPVAECLPQEQIVRHLHDMEL